MVGVTPSSLPLTGERTVPGLVEERYWFLRHEVVYRWWIEQAATSGPKPVSPLVVDAGCGEGYGAAMLADGGARVVAVDYDEQVVAHVHSSYPRVMPLRANLVELPFAAACVETVISLQVIEHLWDLPRFLSECRRVLTDAGALVLSTPNRPVFSPGLTRGERPTNPFHVEEFDAGQVHDVLTSAGFSQVQVLGLHHGERIRQWEERHGSIVAAHVSAALSGTWDENLLNLLPNLRVSDFTIAAPTDAHDLVAVARS